MDINSAVSQRFTRSSTLTAGVDVVGGAADAAVDCDTADDEGTECERLAKDDEEAEADEGVDVTAASLEVGAAGEAAVCAVECGAGVSELVCEDARGGAVEWSVGCMCGEAGVVVDGDGDDEDD